MPLHRVYEFDCRDCCSSDSVRFLKGKLKGIYTPCTMNQPEGVVVGLSNGVCKKFQSRKVIV